MTLAPGNDPQGCEPRAPELPRRRCCRLRPWPNVRDGKVTVPMDIFINYPWMALLPALAFGLLWRRRRSRWSLIAAGAWLAYTVYAWPLWLGLGCAVECSMRVDLILLYPVLVLLSMGAVVAGWRTAPRH